MVRNPVMRGAWNALSPGIGEIPMNMGQKANPVEGSSV